MSDFKVKLPIKGGKIEDFGVKAPNARLAREFYKSRRKIQSMTEDTADRNLLERQLQSEEKQLKVVTGEERDQVRLKEIKKQYGIIEKNREEHDAAYFEAENRNCHLLLDTNVPFEKIEWDEADRREVNGAINFFRHSVSDSSFKDAS